MSNITFLSIFRDRQYVFPRYFNQIEAVEWPYGRKYMVAVENDSRDKTRTILENYRFKEPIGKFVLGETTGEQLYGSLIHPERFRILSNAVNIGLRFIADDLIDTDYVVFIENDIIYKPDIFLKLKETVDRYNCIVAPMVWTERDKIFYDIWAHRDDENDHFPPDTKKYYHQFTGDRMVWSAGTCLMFKTEVLKSGVRFDPNEKVHGAIVSFCRRAYNEGYPTYVNYDVDIFHPQ